MTVPGAPSLIDQVVRVEAPRVIPLVTLGSGRLYDAIASELVRVLPESHRKAICGGSPDDGLALWADVTGPDYRTKIYPATLWPGQAPWFVLINEVESTNNLDALLDSWRQLKHTVAPGCTLLVFLMGSLTEDEWRQKVARLPADDTLVFLLDMTAGPVRDPATLARGVAAFLAAGWRTYLMRRDANLRLALGLHGDEMLYSLGMAEDEPDWRYHRDGWKQALRIELMRRWKQTGGSPPLPERPRALKLIGDLLPSDNYTATADPGKADPGVKVGQVAVGCSFVEQPTPKEFRSPIAADPACDAVSELRLFRDSLWVGERPAAEALVMANFCDWEDARCKEIDRSLSMSTDPNGLFRYFRIRFDQWRDYLRVFCDAEVKPTNGVRSFDENVRLVMQREARIPAWSAGLTRWALMAVATFWTMWGTFFWATRIHPWNDPGLARAFWYSWLGLGGVAVAFGLQMIWVHGSLLRAEALARRDILSEYLAYIMTMINRMLRQRGDVLKDRVDEYAQAFEEMVQALADRDTGGGPPRGGPRVNRNPRFTDAAFQTLRERVLPAMLARAYSGIREDLNGDARWPLFHHDVWEEMVEKNIAEAVSEEFKQLDYDDLVAAAHWSPQECGNRVRELADDARRAAFHIGAPLVATPVALLASLGWVAHVSGLPSVTVSDCRLPCLFAVAALPLCIPNFERGGS